MGKLFFRTFLLLTVVIGSCVTCFVETAESFDGKRKGFVIGGGLGVAPIAHQGRMDRRLTSYETENYGWDSTVTRVTYSPFYNPVNRSAIALQIDIGYAFDERNVLCYREQHAFYSYYDVWSQGMASLTWSHFYGESPGPLYSTVGLGYFLLSNFSSARSIGGIDDGLALSFGVGYEFKRHFACELSFSQGKTNSGLTRCTNVILMLSTTAY